MSEETLTEEKIETEDFITEEALKNAQQGKFEHTMMEMWHSAIGNLINAASAPLNIEVASGILNAYPWLRHDDLQPYMADRVVRYKQALQVIEDVLGDQKEKVFSENENDWELHSDLYLQVMGKWNRLTIQWNDAWASKKPHRVTHATIIDVSGQLLSPEYGFIEGLRNLAGFELTEELKQKLNEYAGVSNG